ncbi:hypothetical protein PINS_up010707 [Pythium insidiosum]|nr:hypothetical protein PINS_up010707 [Pythium insidiosum]
MASVQPVQRSYASSRRLVVYVTRRWYRAVWLSRVALAVLHIASCLDMLWLSWRSGRLVLTRDECRPQYQRPLLKRAVKEPRKLRLPCSAVLSACFGRRGLFGIDSPVFELVFTAREGLEVASQTYQAMQLSARIASPTVNASFVALLVANCWSTPLLQHSLRDRPAAARGICLAIDFIINASANVLVPTLLLVPLHTAWDAEQLTFDIALLYEDVWFGNMVMQLRLLFAASPLDVISKLIPHGSMLFCLLTLREIVRQRADSVGPSAPLSSHSFSRSPPPATILETKTSTRVLTALQMDMHSRKTLVVHFLFVTWGIGVLIVYWLAQHVAHVSFPGCKQIIHPWFVSTFACATLEVNCFRLGKSMTPSEVLHRVHPANLLTLVFSHCEALDVPPEIQRFPNLLGVEIYNATLVSWAEHAALDPLIHRSVVFLLLIHVALPSLPVGLMRPLPETLTDVEFAFTNLTSLPEDLHEHWHGMATFYFEYSQLRSFPRTLCRLPVYDLSLIGNAIETVPELTELSAATSFYTLALSHNPLRALPEGIVADVSIAFLMLEDTKLDTPLPKWVGNQVQERVYIAEALCCLKANASDVQTQPCGLPARVATCTERDPRGDGRYPWATMAPRRAP